MSINRSRGSVAPQHPKPRSYTDDEVARFARYRETRAEVRPPDCLGGSLCWVLHGPPAISRSGYCLGCNRHPGYRRISVT